MESTVYVNNEGIVVSGQFDGDTYGNGFRFRLEGS
jgi:hypothetical protein